jgi:hypothetical protein
MKSYRLLNQVVHFITLLGFKGLNAAALLCSAFACIYPAKRNLSATVLMYFLYYSATSVPCTRVSQMKTVKLR